MTDVCTGRSVVADPDVSSVLGSCKCTTVRTQPLALHAAWREWNPPGAKLSGMGKPGATARATAWSATAAGAITPASAAGMQRATATMEERRTMMGRGVVDGESCANVERRFSNPFLRSPR